MEVEDSGFGIVSRKNTKKQKQKKNRIDKKRRKNGKWEMES
jgi:hypothetical protein